jgi:hypothetical protein
MTDQPLRKALQLTLDGLVAQIPEDRPLPLNGRRRVVANQGSTGRANLRWMCEKLNSEMDNWPTDKISRWIGFVQGVLAAQRFLDVAVERDRTRPFFHEAYAAMGLGTPETSEMPKE